MTNDTRCQNSCDYSFIEGHTVAVVRQVFPALVSAKYRRELGSPGHVYTIHFQFERPVHLLAGIDLNTDNQNLIIEHSVNHLHFTNYRFTKI